MTERRFTVEDANALLPRLSESLERIREARVIVMAAGERIRRVASRNGGGPEGSRYLDALTVLRREMEGMAEDGIIVRDADTGLIDFPSERDGREVFLCWRLGEERVAHWHAPDSGFAGRIPL